MEVKCILKEGINGTGYENMTFNECREISDEVAKTLINFGYVANVETKNQNANIKEPEGELPTESPKEPEGELPTKSPKEPEEEISLKDNKKRKKSGDK